jgi:hypothetical protein
MLYLVATLILFFSILEGPKNTVIESLICGNISLKGDMATERRLAMLGYDLYEPQQVLFRLLLATSRVT